MNRSSLPVAPIPRWFGARWLGALFVALVLMMAARPALAETGPTRFGFGQPMQVDADERVGSVVSIGGDLTVLGEVEEDAVVVGGSLELGPQAWVGGDAVAVGGAVIAQNGATILGDRVEFSGGVIGDTAVDEDAMLLGGAAASSFATFVQVIGSFLISALILGFLPARVRSVSTELRTKPGRAALFGLAILLLFLPLLGALTISIVGIPLIPVAIMLLAAVLVFGMTALALRLGYAMPFYSEDRSAMGALAIGYLLIALVGLIPWLGAVIVPLASVYAGGAVLSTWFRGRRRTQNVAPPPPPNVPPKVEPQPTGL